MFEILFFSQNYAYLFWKLSFFKFCPYLFRGNVVFKTFNDFALAPLNRDPSRHKPPDSQGLGPPIQT